MKISSEHIYAAINPQQGTKNGKASGSFGDMLAQMVAENIPQNPSMEKVAQSGSVTSNDSILPDEWYKVNGLLDSLDDYSRALGNAGQTLKDCEPLVRSIEAQAEELEANLAEIKDPELAQLGQEAIVAATVESLKYWRGDYIS